MGTITDTELYRLTPPLDPGTLHLRLLDPLVSKAAHTADLAAIAASALAAGRPVLYIVPPTYTAAARDFVDALGVKWNDERVTVEYANSTLGVVAAWFEASAHTDPVVLIHDITHVKPSKHANEHPNDEVLAVVDGMLAGNTIELFERTGVARKQAVHHKDTAPLPQATIVAGVQQRTNMASSQTGFVAVGGKALQFRATTKSTIVGEVADGSRVRATGWFLKHPTAQGGVEHRLERDASGNAGRWTSHGPYLN